MKITKTICDICEKEIIEKTWEDKPQKLSFEVTTPDCNPLGNLKERPGFQDCDMFFQDVCKKCCEKIAQSLYDCISEIRNK